MPAHDHHIAVDLFKSTVELESDMRLLLKQKPSYDREVCALRSKLRETYERIIFLDYEYAQSKDVEQNLWKYVFYKVIEDYRKRIRNASPNGKGRPATARKLNSSFRSFLHEATGFYYSFIQKLAVHFGLEQLDPIVKKFGLTKDTRNSRHSYPDNIKQRAVLSCHKSLIFLGDLARYREKQLNKPRKNWSTASDYYNQARQLVPESGNPHNQLAVLATYNDDDFSAVYHYYRSLVVRHPFLTAKDNINLLFQKTRNSFNSAEEKTEGSRQRRFSRMRQGNGTVNKQKVGKAVEEFYAEFIHLHSILFLKSDLELYVDLKKSVLSQLQEYIITRVLDADQLLKVNVINISALFVLRHIINDNGHGLNSEAKNMYGHASKKVLVEKYAFLLVIDTFKLLLDVCESELRDVNSSTETPNNALQLLTAPVKRVLPSIRIGIKWIHANFAYIASMSSAIAEDSNIKEENKEVDKFWENVAKFLNTMERLFPHANGIPLEVPLREDFELNGFLALKNEIGFDLKLFVSESEPFEEIDMRIYDIVEGAHKIVASKAFELYNDNGLFTFKKPLSPMDDGSSISNTVDEGSSVNSDSDLTESHSASPNSSTNLSNDDDTGEVILFTGRRNANQQLNSTVGSDRAVQNMQENTTRHLAANSTTSNAAARNTSVSHTSEEQVLNAIPGAAGDKSEQTSFWDRFQNPLFQNSVAAQTNAMKIGSQQGNSTDSTDFSSSVFQQSALAGAQSATSASVAYEPLAMPQQTVVSSVPNASQDPMVLPQNHQTSGVPAAPSNRSLNSSASLFAFPGPYQTVKPYALFGESSGSFTINNLRGVR